jgi:3-oxoacyl-[acyl-carrier protein] reductase
VPNESGQGRTALITGSSSGIGLAIAGQLLRQGWQVRGWDLAAPAITDSQFVPVAVDLADPAAVDAALGYASTPVDAFVHAAGWMRTAVLADLDLAAGNAMWQLHVQVAHQIAQRLVPAMAQRGHGRVVLIGSRVADGLPGRSQYAAVKAALIASARSWAGEVAGRGVTVNVVSPAATRTPMLADPARAASPPQLPPIGRYVEASEVAALVAFLLSDQAGAMTGQNISICGGATLQR